MKPIVGIDQKYRKVIIHILWKRSTLPLSYQTLKWFIFPIKKEKNLSFEIHHKKKKKSENGYSTIVFLNSWNLQTNDLQVQLISS